MAFIEVGQSRLIKHEFTAIYDFPGSKAYPIPQGTMVNITSIETFGDGDIVRFTTQEPIVVYDNSRNPYQLYKFWCNLQDMEMGLYGSNLLPSGTPRHGPSEVTEMGLEDIPTIHPQDRQKKLDQLLDQYSIEQDPERRTQLENQMRSLKASVYNLVNTTSQTEKDNFVNSKAAKALVLKTDLVAFCQGRKGTEPIQFTMPAGTKVMQHRVTDKFVEFSTADLVTVPLPNGRKLRTGQGFYAPKHDFEMATATGQYPPACSGEEQRVMCAALIPLLSKQEVQSVLDLYNANLESTGNELAPLARQLITSHNLDYLIPMGADERWFEYTGIGIVRDWEAKNEKALKNSTPSNVTERTPDEVPSMGENQRQQALDGLLDQYSVCQDPEERQRLEQRMRDLRAALKFKVGDRVASLPQYGPIVFGEVMVAGPALCRVLWDEGMTQSVFVESIQHEQGQLELEASPKFKDGDRIEPIPGSSIDYKGQGTYLGLAAGSGPALGRKDQAYLVLVQWDGDNCSEIARIDQIQFAPLDLDLKASTKFKVGDRVEYEDTDDGSKRTGVVVGLAELFPGVKVRFDDEPNADYIVGDDGLTYIQPELDLKANADYDMALYEQQDSQIEPLPKAVWNISESNRLGIALENAGDIFRELTVSKWPDPGYIGEKVGKLKRAFQFYKHELGAEMPAESKTLLDQIASQFSSFDLSTKSPVLMACRDLNVALAQQDLEKAESLLPTFDPLLKQASKFQIGDRVCWSGFSENGTILKFYTAAGGYIRGPQDVPAKAQVLLDQGLAICAWFSELQLLQGELDLNADSRQDLEDQGWAIVEAAKLGVHTFTLTKHEVPQGSLPWNPQASEVFQLGMEREGHDFTEVEQQGQKYPASRTGEIKPVIDLIKGWVAKYGPILVKSHSDDRTEQYFRIMTRYGLETQRTELGGHDTLLVTASARFKEGDRIVGRQQYDGILGTVEDCYATAFGDTLYKVRFDDRNCQTHVNAWQIEMAQPELDIDASPKILLHDVFQVGDRVECRPNAMIQDRGQGTVVYVPKDLGHSISVLFDGDSQDYEVYSGDIQLIEPRLPMDVEAEHKFKIGDRVTAAFGDIDNLNGVIVELPHEENGFYGALFDNRTQVQYLPAEYFQLAQTELFPTASPKILLHDAFHIGDRVEIKPNAPINDLGPGTVIYVPEKVGQSLSVRFDQDDDSWEVFPGDIQLIEPRLPMDVEAEHKFEIGDRVRTNFGETGIIEEIFSQQTSKVRFDSGHSFYQENWKLQPLQTEMDLEASMEIEAGIKERLPMLIKQFYPDTDEAEAAQFITSLVPLDPTGEQGKYLTWLLKNKIEPEDTEVGEQLAIYNKAKNKGEFPADKKDINRISPDELPALVEQYGNLQSKREKKYDKGWKVIRDDDQWKIIEISNQKAASELHGFCDAQGNELPANVAENPAYRVWCVKQPYFGTGSADRPGYLVKGPVYWCISKDNAPDDPDNYELLVHPSSGEVKNLKNDTPTQDIKLLHDTLGQDPSVGKSVLQMQIDTEDIIHGLGDGTFKISDIPDNDLDRALDLCMNEFENYGMHVADISYAMAERDLPKLISAYQLAVSALERPQNRPGRYDRSLGAKELLKNMSVETLGKFVFDSQKPELMATFAIEILKDRWPQAEPAITADPNAYALYRSKFDEEEDVVPMYREPVPGNPPPFPPKPPEPLPTWHDHYVEKEPDLPLVDAPQPEKEGWNWTPSGLQQSLETGEITQDEYDNHFRQITRKPWALPRSEFYEDGQVPPEGAEDNSSQVSDWYRKLPHDIKKEFVPSAHLHGWIKKAEDDPEAEADANEAADATRAQEDETFEESGPQDDDIVIGSDRGRYRAFQNRKEIASDADLDHLIWEIKQYMEKQQYWPNVWEEEERGGFHLVDISTVNEDPKELERQEQMAQEKGRLVSFISNELAERGPLDGEVLWDKAFSSSNMSDAEDFRVIWDQAIDALIQDGSIRLDSDQALWYSNLPISPSKVKVTEDTPETPDEVPGFERGDREQRLDSLLDQFAIEEDPERRQQLIQQLRSLQASLRVEADVASRAPILIKSFPTLFNNIAPEEALPFLTNLAEKVDPTGQLGKYLPWILKQIVNLEWPSPEQYQEAKDLLTIYDKLKNKKGFPEDKRDINQLDHTTLQDTVSQFRALQTRNEAIKAGTKVKYNKDGITVTELSTPEAAAEVCKNTGWCVVNPDTARSYLKSGPLVKVDQHGDPVLLWSGDGNLEGPHNEYIEGNTRQIGSILDTLYPDRDFASDFQSHEENHNNNDDPEPEDDRGPIEQYNDGDINFGDLDPGDMRQVLEDDDENDRRDQDGNYDDNVNTLIRASTTQALAYLCGLEDEEGNPLEQRWPLLERKILEHGRPEEAVEYATKILRSRWPQAEPLIYQSEVAKLQYEWGRAGPPNNAEHPQPDGSPGYRGPMTDGKGGFGDFIAPYTNETLPPERTEREEEPGRQPPFPNMWNAKEHQLAKDLPFMGTFGGEAKPAIVPAGTRVELHSERGDSVTLRLMEGGIDGATYPLDNVHYVDVPAKDFWAALKPLADPQCLTCGKPEDEHPWSTAEARENCADSPTRRHDFGYAEENGDGTVDPAICRYCHTDGNVREGCDTPKMKIAWLWGLKGGNELDNGVRLPLNYPINRTAAVLFGPNDPPPFPEPGTASRLWGWVYSGHDGGDDLDELWFLVNNTYALYQMAQRELSPKGEDSQEMEYLPVREHPEAIEFLRRHFDEINQEYLYNSQDEIGPSDVREIIPKIKELYKNQPGAAERKLEQLISGFDADDMADMEADLSKDDFSRMMEGLSEFVDKSKGVTRKPSPKTKMRADDVPGISPEDIQRRKDQALDRFNAGELDGEALQAELERLNRMGVAMGWFKKADETGRRCDGCGELIKGQMVWTDGKAYCQPCDPKQDNLPLESVADLSAGSPSPVPPKPHNQDVPLEAEGDLETDAAPKRHYTLEELEEMPTISQGQFDNLKYDDGKVRVWLSRMTRADGANYDKQVTVEHLQNGCWVTVESYEPTSTGESESTDEEF